MSESTHGAQASSGVEAGDSVNEKKWVRFDDHQTAIDFPPGDSQNKSPPQETSVAQIDVSIEQQEHLTPKSSPLKANGGASYAPATMTAVATGVNNGSSSASATSPFENGKHLTTILPENELCPWILPANFNAYKMPKTLISEGITMPVEDYVMAMEMLTNDFRFRGYTVCYRRLISAWLVLAFLILLVILVSNVAGGLMLFGLVLIWMFLVAVGVIVCLMIKKQINKGLHHAVRSVNSVLMKYNLMVAVEDIGKLSCHKISIHFLYIRTDDCLPRVMQLLAQYDQARGTTLPSVSVQVEHVRQGVFNAPEERARALMLKYSQSYAKAVVRRTIRFPSRPAEGVSEFSPLHCSKVHCLCQYLQKHHFERKPRGCCERFFLVGDMSIADLEQPYGGGSTPLPPQLYAHM